MAAVYSLRFFSCSSLPSAPSSFPGSSCVLFSRHFLSSRRAVAGTLLAASGALPAAPTHPDAIGIHSVSSPAALSSSFCGQLHCLASASGVLLHRQRLPRATLSMTATTTNPSRTSPNHALQRTAPAVTLAASCLRLSPTAQPSRQPPPSLSLGSLGVATRSP